MKKLILALLLVSSVAFAEEIPDYMKDGVITVTLKSGKTYTYSLNEYKVVRRGTSKAAEPATKAEVQKAVKEAHAKHNNRVRVMGGVGPTDLSVTRNANSATIKSENGAVGGVGYDRMITDELSVGGAALTNGTYLLNLGVDF